MLHSTRMMLARPASGGGGTLDTQTVTVGDVGTAIEQNRQRGFIASYIGSISDGTSNIYGGLAITKLYWDEGLARYNLTIPGAANSGWTTMVIGSTSFTRASAGYANGNWFWSAPDATITTQAFGSIGGDVIVTFS